MGVQCVSQRGGDYAERELTGDQIPKNLKIFGPKGREKARPGRNGG